MFFFKARTAYQVCIDRLPRTRKPMDVSKLAWILCYSPTPFFNIPGIMLSEGKPNNYVSHSLFFCSPRHDKNNGYPGGGAVYPCLRHRHSCGLLHNAVRSRQRRRGGKGKRLVVSSSAPRLSRRVMGTLRSISGKMEATISLYDNSDGDLATVIFY